MDSKQDTSGPATCLFTTRAQKKQAVILDVATELFLERGYDAVSLDDIIERIGGSKTTLYSYYGGKEGLFAATVQKRCHDKLSIFSKMDVGHLSPSAGLFSLGKAFLLMLSDPHGHALFRIMIAEAHRFPELASSFFNSGPQEAIGVLQRNMEHWQKQGLLRPGNTEAFAIQFMGMLMGNFHLKSLLGLIDSLTEQQTNHWVESGVELFLQGALVRTE